MPIYYFHLRGEGFEVPDLAGKECVDAAAARAEAERLVAEIRETARLSGKPPLPATIEVDDEQLRPVLTLPLVQAAAA